MYDSDGSGMIGANICQYFRVGGGVEMDENDK